MPSDLAWKQRVNQEDRNLLAQVIEARRRLAESTARPCRDGSSVAESQGKGNAPLSKPVLSKREVAPPIGTSIRAPPSSSGSVAPSCRSSTTTQLSHRGASTIQGSAALSQMTAFSTRLEKLEQRLADEHKERMRVTDELTQIRQLLLQQQQNISAGRKSR
jgi:hypothetical protein